MTPTRPPVRAVILDFDGLILDTESPIFEEWRVAFASRGHTLSLDDWQHALGTFGGYDPCAHLAELSGEPFDHEVLKQEVRTRNLARCEQQPLLPGVEALLREAKVLGLGRAVASSSSSQWVEGWLVRHGIRELFEAVCTRDHVERVKPAPDLFLLAASRLGVAASECVVFEDSPNGIRAARAAGMACVAVPNDITRPLPLGDADLQVSSLAETPLPEILRALGERA